jgi:plasmid maintenance system antidote protein VapI
MNLKEYLYENDLTVSAFADMIGYHRAYLSDILRGKVRISERFAYKVKQVTNGKVLMGNQENSDKKAPGSFKGMP